LIIEEFIVGRQPTDLELAYAEELKRSMIKQDPKSWLAVDVDYDDVIMRANGRPCFIDVGDFRGISPKNYERLQQLYFPKQLPHRQVMPTDLDF
jgi:hypothetical protein